MQPQKTPSPFALASFSSEIEQFPALAVQLTHLIEYFGAVSNASNERVLHEIKDTLIRDPDGEIVLLITSAGGPSGAAMSFFDTVRCVLRPRLTTIGAGDVDSSGVILFQTGATRLVTPHTTMLLHPAGRILDDARRFTAEELRAMEAEDRLKDDQYASILAERSNGRLTKRRALNLMSRHTVLAAPDIVRHGLADGILKNSR